MLCLERNGFIVCYYLLELRTTLRFSYGTKETEPEHSEQKRIALLINTYSTYLAWI